MTLYSKEVREFILSRKWPKGLQYHIAEATDPEPHLNIVFFRDNWITLDFDAQMQATAVVKEIMAKLWADGIPTYVGKMESAYT